MEKWKWTSCRGRTGSDRFELGFGRCSSLLSPTESFKVTVGNTRSQLHTLHTGVNFKPFTMCFTYCERVFLYPAPPWHGTLPIPVNAAELLSHHLTLPLHYVHQIICRHSCCPSRSLSATFEPVKSVPASVYLYFRTLSPHQTH